jgi:hypothetical protein
LQDPLARDNKQADLATLEQVAAEGHLRLKYLDETGFDSWSSVSYSWFSRGRQKRQEQTPRRGRRVNVIGVLEPDQQMEYALGVGSLTSARYIKLMDWQAAQAARRLKRIGQITVIAQDNAPIHTSHAVRDRIALWQSQGLYLFHFPKYCSEMNEIECEWRRVKADEIRGQMFEDEYDLAIAVIKGMKSRGQKAGYKAKRFGFKSQRMIE